MKTGLAIVLLATAIAASGRVAAQEFPARVDWSQRYHVSTPVAGVVREIAVRTGDLVEAGQLLFSLDTRRIQADLRAAGADRARLRLELAEADREVERAEDLYDRTLIAVRELELARIQRSMAAARLAQAEAQLDRIGADLDDSRIRAPAPARVLSIEVTPGEAVNPSLAPPVLAVLGRIEPMRAVTTVGADLAAGLPRGQPAWVHIGDHAIAGTVAEIGWELEDLGFGPGYRVGIEFLAPDPARLRAGQEVRVRLDATE